MKRLFITFLALILTFSFPLSVFADNPLISGGSNGDVNGDGVIDYRDWTNLDKVQYWVVNVGFFLCHLTSISTFPTSTSDAYNLACRKAATRGYQNFGEFMVQNSTYVPANQDSNNPQSHFDFSSDALQLFNEVKVEIDSDVTNKRSYYVMYPVAPSVLPDEYFRNSYAKQGFADLVNANPDMVFGVAQQQDGNRGLAVFCFEKPFCAVANMGKDDDFVYVSLYDRSLQNIRPQNTDTYWTLFYPFEFTQQDFVYINSDGTVVQIPYRDLNLSQFDVDEIVKANVDIGALDYFRYALTSNRYDGTVEPTIYNNYTQPCILYSTQLQASQIPVFFNEVDMVSDLSGKTAIPISPQYVPGQTITDNSVNTSTINNIVNNYNRDNPDNPVPVINPDEPFHIPEIGNGDVVDNPNNPNNPSGGEQDEEPISTDGGILTAIKRLVNLIFSPLSNALNFISTKIETIINTVTGLITNITDLFTTNGFVKVMTAVFPFLPEAWKTLITMALTLALLGVLARFLFNLFTK